MNNIQIEDSINKLNAQMQALGMALAEINPELSESYGKHLNETMKLVNNIQKLRAEDALPGRRQRP